MKELRKKSFKNGVVYCLQLKDGFLVETTDTFLPFILRTLLADIRISSITTSLVTVQNVG